jgi:hypothetical protein
MYKTGGLEPSEDKPETLSIEGINYVVSDKFKTMLRDSFIDWGTFLEIYKANMNDSTMFDQIIKLLNVKDNENLRDTMLPLVKKIYQLPASAHMICMVKQFMIYEPVSMAAHALFTAIKKHFEEIVERYIAARNKYINLQDTKDKVNDINELVKYWSEMNISYNLDTSSVILLFINPPQGIKSELHIKIKGIPESSMLKRAIKHFHYPGFCPKVPHKRLAGLLTFPVNEFIKTIKKIDPEAKFPNYTLLEKRTKEILHTLGDKPEIPDDYKRQQPPKDITEKIELIKWYVDEILNLRKSLLKYGREYEKYYANHAKILTDLTDIIKTEFTHLH